MPAPSDVPACGQRLAIPTRTTCSRNFDGLTLHERRLVVAKRPTGQSRSHLATIALALVMSR